LVYALVDPRTLLVRYIGQSSTGMDRPREHACPSRLKRRTHKSAWIKSLAKVGLRYVIAVLETVDSIDRLNDCETWWMMFGRALGWDLTNHAPAGGSVRGLVRSVETREALKGKPLPEATIARMSIARRKPPRLLINLMPGRRR